LVYWGGCVGPELPGNELAGCTSTRSLSQTFALTRSSAHAKIRYSPAFSSDTEKSRAAGDMARNLADGETRIPIGSSTVRETSVLLGSKGLVASLSDILAVSPRRYDGLSAMISMATAFTAVAQIRENAKRVESRATETRTGLMSAKYYRRLKIQLLQVVGHSSLSEEHQVGKRTPYGKGGSSP